MKTSFKKQSGFTLIELIVVIVILGIMAAIAGPRFVDLQSDARLSVMQGVEGSIRSAATLVYSKALIESIESTDEGGGTPPSVDVQGGTVLTKFGYPSAGTSATPPVGGLMNAIDLSGDIVVTGDASTITFTYGTITACNVTYAEAANAGDSPTITNNATSANC